MCSLRGCTTKIITMFAKSTFTGRLTRDPEIKEISQDSTVVEISLAVGRIYKGKESVSYFDLQAWDKVGLYLAKKLKKGDGLSSDCELTQQRWVDKETGNHRKREVHTIRAFGIFPRSASRPTPEKDVEFIPAVNDGIADFLDKKETEPTPKVQPTLEYRNYKLKDEDDDIPF